MRSEIDLWKIEYEDWTDEELLTLLERDHTTTEIPPCRVCGGSLSIQAIGGGRPTVWACSGQDESGKYLPGRRAADEHYSESRFEDRRHTDGRIHELIRRYKERE